MHRDGIRPRPIDDHKPYLVYKDLEQAKRTADKERETQINDIEKDLYHIIEYFDKIKKNQIPKAKIINEKNDKNDNNVNYHINNNIIYKPEKNDASNQNNSQYILNCKLTEFKRPDSYIIYSSSLQNQVNSQRKIYEATEADRIFLNIRENFMTLEELENIIIDLEENCINEKEDKVNEESARKIIETKYSKYLNYIDSIINHFKDRRASIKKSFIRQRWHKNKSTDKFLTNTFKKRTTDKRQTRKSNQNKEESLNKIIEAENYCKNYLASLMKDMTIKETSNKTLLKIEEFIFQSEIEKIKKITIPIGRIKENNIIKDKIEKNMKLFKEKENKKINDGNEIKIGKEHKNNKLALNDLSNNPNDIKNKSNINSIPIININKSEELNFLNNDNKNGNNNSLENSSNNNKKINEKKPTNNKNLNKNKGNEVFPNVSLNCLLDNNISLNEEENNMSNNIIKANNIKNNVRIRIRINRNNQIVIDRYIQHNNDFDPFDDGYNNIFDIYKNYEVNELEYLNNNNFEKLYKSYNLNKFNNLSLLGDSEDEDIIGDVKQFSNSYKQFLKAKRSQAK
jgi:hypothetical protein